MADPVYRPAALTDLDAIFDYIAEDNPPRAQSFISDIRARCRSASNFPHLGPSRPDLGPGVRILPLPPRVVVAYRVGQDGVIVLRVLYGGRDYDALAGCIF